MRLRYSALVVSALLASVCAGVASPEEESAAEAAEALASQAKKAAKHGHNAEAYLLYSEAFARQPKEAKFKRLMDSLKAKAQLEEAKAADARAAAAKAAAGEAAPDAAAAEPDNPDKAPAGPEVFDSFTAREFAKARQPLAPPALAGKPGTQDFDLNGPARSLFDQVAQRFGLKATYDNDFQATGPQIRFRVTGVDYRAALNDLEAATGAFVVTVSPGSFLVAQDTPQKRNELEQTMSISIPVPQAMTTQELTEIAQAVRQATNIEKLAWNTAQNEIVIRDRVSRVMPAEALLQQLFSYRAEVMVELEFLEMSDSDIRNYGFNVTKTFEAFYLGRLFNNLTSIPTSFANLVTFGGGKTLIGLTIAEAQAMFNETKTSGRSLFRAQVRTTDGQPATFHTGEKYPIITSGYTGNLGTSGLALPPAFTFEDLGLLLKVTPHVHGMGDMTLTVETNFELLTGNAVNGIPVLGRRLMNTQVRLHDGEWIVVAGLMNPSESKAVNGFWGLSQIPLLGNLFKQVSTDKEDSNILIVIKPHLLSLPPDQIVTKSLRVGTETRPFSPL